MVRDNYRANLHTLIRDVIKKTKIKKPPSKIIKGKKYSQFGMCNSSNLNEAIADAKNKGFKDIKTVPYGKYYAYVYVRKNN